MAVRDLASGRLVRLGFAKLSTTDAETVAFDFGTPNDINLAASGSGYRPGDRILVTVTAVRDAGTTSTITLVVQDSADNGSGAIGTPGTAVTDGTLLTAAADGQTLVTMVQVRPNKPWLRLSVTNSSATDTVLCYCTVWSVPRGV